MNDREILELAAKAAGISLHQWVEQGCWLGEPEEEGFQTSPPELGRWNPLTDDGDALRLAVKLRHNINFEEYDGVEYACATPIRSHQGKDEAMGDDEMAAIRRAIVRAAAEIGKLMAKCGRLPVRR